MKVEGADGEIGVQRFGLLLLANVQAGRNRVTEGMSCRSLKATGGCEEMQVLIEARIGASVNYASCC